MVLGVPCNARALRRHRRAATVRTWHVRKGQATVELLGVVPALVALGLVVWQLTLVGHAAWMTAHAARAAARAELVGEDAEAAARSAFRRRSSGTRRSRRGDRRDAGGGAGADRDREWGSPVKIAARAALEPVR